MDAIEKAWIMKKIEKHDSNYFLQRYNSRNIDNVFQKDDISWFKTQFNFKIFA